MNAIIKIFINQLMGGTMEERLHYLTAAPGAYKAMLGLDISIRIDIRKLC